VSGFVRRIACVMTISIAPISCAAAAELPIEGLPSPPVVFAPPLIPQWEFEIGARYFLSSGRTKIDVGGIDQPPPGFFPGVEFSRLTYSSLTANSGELFGRAEHRSGFFAKGVVGGGSINKGNLQDEDFPVGLFPNTYSNTSSDQRGGTLRNAIIDLGWDWRGDTFRGGFFAGYSYYHEVLNAYGCTQAALSLICVPSIPSSILGITQDNSWHSLRLGYNGQWQFAPGWRLETDMAWMPFAVLSADDTHFLRPDIGGPTDETGRTIFGLQLEALVSYFWNGFSIGVGGRYWRWRTDGARREILNGTIPFLGAPLGAGLLSQQLDVITERWGIFFQASYKFRQLSPTRYN
jgi:hypothetical protein